MFAFETGGHLTRMYDKEKVVVSEVITMENTGKVLNQYFRVGNVAFVEIFTQKIDKIWVKITPAGKTSENQVKMIPLTPYEICLSSGRHFKLAVTKNDMVVFADENKAVPVSTDMDLIPVENFNYKLGFTLESIFKIDTASKVLARYFRQEESIKNYP